MSTFNRKNKALPRPHNKTVKEQQEEKFEASYFERGVEKEIPDWKGRTVESAKIVHLGSDGRLTVAFTDGTTKRYGFNELGLWEENP